VYHGFEMRRGISISLFLLFWLGPLAAVLQASGQDSRLPACCRRHGAHHCGMITSMDDEAALAAGDPGATFTAPAHCPIFPRALAPRYQSQSALTVHSGGLHFALDRMPLAAIRAEALLRNFRDRSVRGPPSLTLG